MRRFRLPPSVVFWALAAVTLLVSHDAIWLIQMGPGEDLASALRTMQHGYLAVASVTILILAVGATLATATRTYGLLRRARLLDASVPAFRRRHLVARAAVAWFRLFAVVGVGFAIQENVEHFLAHGHALGVGAITGPEYPLAIPVLAGVTAVAALLFAAVRVVEADLVAGIAAALRRVRLRAPRIRRRAQDVLPLRRRSAMSGRDAGRAPPILLVGS
jgi:hypothetical protein